MFSRANLSSRQGILKSQKYWKHYFANTGDKIQDAPILHNPAICDPLMLPYLKERHNAQTVAVIGDDLQAFGSKIVDYIHNWGLQCEQEPPKLEQYDAWNRRVDRLYTSDAWKRMKSLSAKEGLVALAYNPKSLERNQYSRLHQMLKMYLYYPSSGLYSCPLAMTDGAAKVIELLGRPEPLQSAYQRLTSWNPEEFWTSGQWMTERMGGSDVGHGTETVAYSVEGDGSHSLLHGYKWFSSATDADMALALARELDSQQQPIAGSAGLSLFYVQLRDPLYQPCLPSGLNGIQIVRLKQKLGTKQLPTAELLLDGARALKVSESGRGVASVAGMLHITRLHCIGSNVAAMRRVLQLANDYASRRYAFGRLIAHQPLHQHTLHQLEADCQASFLGFVQCVELYGKLEVQHSSSSKSNEDEVMLSRLLIALLKAFTSRQAVIVVSEGLECFGGQGYMEDTGLPQMLRDIHVNCIWEGTSNIISLDALRTIQKSSGKALFSLFHLMQETCERVATGGHPAGAKSHVALAEWAVLQKLSQNTLHRCQQWGDFLLQVMQPDQMQQEQVQGYLREMMFGITRLYLGTRLIENCTFAQTDADLVYRRQLAEEWFSRDISTLERIQQGVLRRKQ